MIVSNVLKAALVAMLLPNHPILAGVRCQLIVKACDVGQVIKNHVKKPVFSNYSAGLKTGVHLSAQYFCDLLFLEQKKLLHTQTLPGNGSMVLGNGSTPVPRGIVFLSSFSCARALS